MMTRTVDACLVGKTNNFDALRLFAALLVLWSHSYPLTQRGAKDIFSRFLYGYDVAGSFAVLIFFVISGFLVTKSVFERRTDQYIMARALRIMPALALAVVTTVFVLGPVMTELPYQTYLRDPATLPYLYNMLVFGIVYDIPAATKGLPYAGSINSSLWTLSLECGFYVLLVPLMHIRLLSARFMGIFAAVIVLGYFICVYSLGLNDASPGPTLWLGARLFFVAKNGSAFFLGAALWVYRGRIPLNASLAILCCIALFAARFANGAVVVYTLTVPYLVIYLALALPAINLKSIGDLSYGIYLFAFPVQQAVISHFGPRVSATKLSIIATAIVFVTASLSWRLIERPALRLKTIRTVARAPSVQGEIEPSLIFVDDTGAAGSGATSGLG